MYADLLFSVIKEGSDLKLAVRNVAKALDLDLDEVVKRSRDDTTAIANLGSACYIESSFPCVLYLAYKYSGKCFAQFIYQHRCRWTDQVVALITLLLTTRAMLDGGADLLLYKGALFCKTNTSLTP